MEANRISLQSKTNKRKRSTLVVNASNSGQVNSLFHLNICYWSIKLRWSTTNCIYYCCRLFSQLLSHSGASNSEEKQKNLLKEITCLEIFQYMFQGQDPIATCNRCGQIYSCDQSTHGTSTLWYHLRNSFPEDPLKGQGLYMYTCTPDILHMYTLMHRDVCMAKEHMSFLRVSGFYFLQVRRISF